MTQLAQQEPNLARELRRVPEFESATDETLTAIAKMADSRTVRSRTSLVEQGSKAPGALIVLRGAVKSVRRTEADERNSASRKRHHGDFVLLDVLRAPCLHIDASLLDDTPASASLVTLRASWVCVVDWAELRRTLAGDVGFENSLLLHLAGRERAFIRRIDELALGPVDERVIHLLDGLARDFGTPVGGGRFIALPLRRQDLAAMVNATTETVSRLLARLEREGKARTTRDGIWWSGNPQKLTPGPGSGASGSGAPGAGPGGASVSGTTLEGGSRVAS